MFHLDLGGIYFKYFNFPPTKAMASIDAELNDLASFLAIFVGHFVF